MKSLKLIAVLLAASLPIAAMADKPEPIAKVGGNPMMPDIIELYDERGDICPEGTRSTVYHVRRGPGAGAEIPGCWILRGTEIFLAFADGDKGRAQATEFTWKPGSKPVRANGVM